MDFKVLAIAKKYTDEIVTETGLKGKSAYEYAVEGGYVGTEQDFINILGTTKEIIVDVVSLPNTNINEKALYRLLRGNLMKNFKNQDNFYVKCVNVLPESNIDESYEPRLHLGTYYYNISDNQLYGYLS